MMKDKFELQFFAEEEGTPETETDTPESEGTEGAGSSILGEQVESTEEDKEEAPEPSEEETAPEKYDEFKMPEGFTADEEATTKFTGVAKELNLSQDQAQKLVDLYAEQAKASREQAISHLETLHTSWEGDLKEEWGEGFKENCSHVQKAVAGADEGFLALLNGQDPNFPGVILADHPAVAKYLASMGKKMGEQALVDGKMVSGKQSEAEILFGSVDVNTKE